MSISDLICLGNIHNLCQTLELVLGVIGLNFNMGALYTQLRPTDMTADKKPVSSVWSDETHLSLCLCLCPAPASPLLTSLCKTIIRVRIVQNFLIALFPHLLTLIKTSLQLPANHWL